MCLKNFDIKNLVGPWARGIRRLHQKLEGIGGRASVVIDANRNGGATVE